MRRLLFLFLLCAATARGQQSQNIRLLCHWSDTTGIPLSGGQYFNDVWGFTAKGVEYGVIGSTVGAHVIRVSDCQQVAFYPGRSGPQVIHRDYKTYDHYLYAVADEGLSTLQIFDLNFLPDSLHLVYETPVDTPLLAHTLFIDTAKARLYLASPKQNLSVPQSYMRVYSLANPVAPVVTHQLGIADNIAEPVHALFARNDTAFLSVGNSGLLVSTFNAANQFSIISGLTSYPQQGYNHTSWVGENGIGVMTDETHGLQVKVLDATQLSTQGLRIASYFSPCSSDTCVPHNCFMVGDRAIMAHYYQGLQVYSLANPNAPVRTGYFDTYDPPAGNGGFAGAWGCYPFLSGNKVLISDMQSGFYVVDASAALGVEGVEGAPETALQIFPNPAHDFVSLRLSRALRGEGRVEVLEGISGSIVLKTTWASGTETLRVPLPAPLSAGLYFIRVVSPEGTATARFFKN